MGDKKNTQCTKVPLSTWKIKSNSHTFSKHLSNVSTKTFKNKLSTKNTYFQVYLDKIENTKFRFGWVNAKDKIECSIMTINKSIIGTANLINFNIMVPFEVLFFLVSSFSSSFKNYAYQTYQFSTLKKTAYALFTSWYEWEYFLNNFVNFENSFQFFKYRHFRL